MPQDQVRRDAPEPIAESVIRLPLPFRGQFVNSYLVLGADGPRLVDTGIGGERSMAALEGHLEAFGFNLRDVVEVLVTHAHPDHVGGATRLAASGARLLMHPAEAVAYERGDRRFNRHWLVANGLPAELAEQLPRATPPPLAAGEVEDSEDLSFGHLRLKLVICPGHSPGQVCAYDGEHGLLFSADQLLKVPTPIATTEPPLRDSVGDYLAGLDRIAALPVDRVLPGHGRSFGAFSHALAAARSGQEARADGVLEALPADGASAHQLAVALKIHEQFSPGLSPANAAALALGRVAAILRHLEARGRVVAEDGDGAIRFRPR